MEKTILFLFLPLMAVFHANAQHKFRFGLGLNDPVSIEQYGGKENHLCFYIDGIYCINKNINIDLSASCENYTSVIKIDNLKDVNNGRSLAVIPSVDYLFDVRTKTVKPYAGLGLGLSFDNLNTGIFNDGMKCHVTLAPKVGFRIINHIDVFARYNITHKDFNRLIIGIGYIF